MPYNAEKFKILKETQEFKLKKRENELRFYHKARENRESDSYLKIERTNKLNYIRKLVKDGVSKDRINKYLERIQSQCNHQTYMECFEMGHRYLNTMLSDPEDEFSHKTVNLPLKVPLAKEKPTTESTSGKGIEN
tara:strand:+ start:445 stop:849 length:405 start_codon:yes stop_codon:yes gene_type:complete